jgi:hypothetical protein
MGTVGEDYYARLTGWITPKLMLGFELDARSSETLRISSLPTTCFRKIHLRGDDGLDHLIRLELTRSFR